MWLFALRAELNFTQLEQQQEVLKQQPWASRPVTVGWTLFNLAVFYGIALGPLLKQWVGWQAPVWADPWLGWGFLFLCVMLAGLYGTWHLRRLISRGPGSRHRLYHLFSGLSAVLPLAGLVYLALNSIH